MRAIDLFCGAGGSSLGAAAAGVEIVAGFDVWPVAGSVYRANFPHARFYPCDLATLMESDIRVIRDDLGPVDLLLASPPCTDHSPARGAKPPSAGLDLPWCVWAFARVFLPRWIVVENVVQMRRWHGYRALLHALMRLGYRVCVRILDAADFAVPQRRKRLYVVCDREADPPEIVPRASERIPAARVVDLNGYAYNPLYTPRRAARTIERVERALRALGRDVPFISVYYGSGPQWQTLDAPLRTVTTRGHFALVRPDGDGGHEMRMLQADELRRAMSFPMWFDFGGCTRTDAMRLLGNAVCPPVMQAIVEELMRCA
jgi:DNA (cytosine-5)-methyltransferase 1